MNKLTSDDVNHLNTSAYIHSVVYIRALLPFQLVSDNKLTSDDVSHMYTSVLQGLHVHGQHEGQQAMLLSLGLQVYEFLVSGFTYCFSCRLIAKAM